MTTENLTTQQRFEKELAKISFQELQKLFAKGMIVIVSSQVNLIEVAMKLHQDDSAIIELWIKEKKIIRAHDDHAKTWVAQRAELMAVTVAPWVLVQEIVNEE
jgi:hypothetical protein